MIATNTKRPRNVDWPRAAAILYGDWGTSKAYVVGLAFAVAGYGSFWLIGAMSLLTALVGINYMVICRHYPDGGGVYASVRHRSEIVSIVGAFLLIADYLVTAAISSLSAFQYLGVPRPEIFAALAIVMIGALNFFGPRHTGGLAFLISLPTVVVVVLLGAFCLPHLGHAIQHLEPLQGGFLKNWKGFVGVVLALSGVEAIANATGVMKLNPGSSDANPNVSKTSNRAILLVMVEVCFFTVLLSLGAHALNGLIIDKDQVDAPGNPGVRDYMLRYMGQVFVGGALGPTVGHIAAWAVSIVFAFLLLSAVNTAIVDLIAIQFLMSRDRELPSAFQRLNKFGVPNLAIVLSTVIPMLLVLAVSDMAGLADLYAVGVVGAIATNLGATSTDKKVRLAQWERALMFLTFLVMLAIEISLFIDKPGARVFAVTILAIGLILRGLVTEAGKKKDLAAAAAAAATVPVAIETNAAQGADAVAADRPPIVCAVRGAGKTLDFALEEAQLSRRPLYLLFVRALPALSEADHSRRWQEDEEARMVFAQAKDLARGHPVFPCYAVSDSVADTIVDITATMGASLLILGAPVRNRLLHLLRGDIVQRVSEHLPEDIHLLVYA
ncbi:MAG TPA: universal stress protein [Verrucomicrobiae bacterium]|nr:universal stress protein [Verrucomicrobiae bacterium]